MNFPSYLSTQLVKAHCDIYYPEDECAVSKPRATPLSPIELMADELVNLVMQHLSLHDSLSVIQSCRRFNSPVFWRQLILRSSLSKRIVKWATTLSPSALTAAQWRCLTQVSRIQQAPWTLTETRRARQGYEYMGLNREGHSVVVSWAQNSICSFSDDGQKHQELTVGDKVTITAGLSRGGYFLGTSSGTICVWSNDQKRKRLVGHKAEVTCFKTLPDGCFVSGSDDFTVIKWSKDGHKRQVLKGHNASVSCLAVYPDGRIASGSDDKSVRIWPAKGRGSQRLAGHTGAVTCLQILLDGFLASGSSDKTVRIWSADGRKVKTIHHQETVRCLAVLRDGRLVSGCDDWIIRIWAPDGQAPQELHGNGGRVTWIQEFPDRSLASESPQGMRIWKPVRSVRKPHSDLAEAVLTSRIARLMRNPNFLRTAIIIIALAALLRIANR